MRHYSGCLNLKRDIVVIMYFSIKLFNLNKVSTKLNIIFDQRHGLFLIQLDVKREFSS
jgi:hypothetical protein